MNVRPAKGTHGWTNRERNGYVLLCSLLFIPLATEFLFRYSHKETASLTSSVSAVETPISKSDTVSTEKKNLITSEYKPAIKIIVDINKADSIALLEVKGIGPVLAGRIVKYRNLLGGYVAVEQLKEVYGLKEEFYDKIKSQVKLTSGPLKKIEVDSLLLNPYSVYHPYWDKVSKKELVLAKKKGVSEDSLIQMIYSDKNKHWKDYLNK